MVLGLRELTLLASAAVAVAAVAQPPAAERGQVQEGLAPESLSSASLGRPTYGELREGRRLGESAAVRHVHKFAADGNFYGTPELVAAVDHAARTVRARFPGSILPVGELSSLGGGPISGHRSHESGRDVDVGFYLLDDRGRSVEFLDSFVEFDRTGRGLPPHESLRFDDDRNWALLSALLSQPAAPVQWVFLHQGLQARLFATAHRRGASSALLARARRVLRRPANASPHRGHLHVRIYCAPDDRPECLDVEPFHAWYPGVPPYRVLDPFVIGSRHARFRSPQHPVERAGRQGARMIRE